MSITENLQNIRSRIKTAAEKSGRRESDIKLVCVTKHRSIEDTNEVLKTEKCIGENRIHEVLEKFPQIKGLDDVEKHMIGHLQTNKAKKAVELFDMIESVDSQKLAKEINKHARSAGKVMPVLLQVNISGEEQKQGIEPDAVSYVYEQIKDLPNIRVAGLMAMAPFVEPEKTRPYFRNMKEIFDRFDFEWLSMGMTNDFEIAIEEGSNIIRVGTAIFK